MRQRSLHRVSAETSRRGALDVLLNGLKDSGCKFRLAYFRPASGLNEETRRLHAANRFAVVRQVYYSTNNEKTVCVVSCQRSPEPVFLKWKGVETAPSGDYFVRCGPGTVKLAADSAHEYIRTRFPAFTRA